MPNIHEFRDGEVKFDLEIIERPVEFYADGLGQIMLGPINSKISFYTSNGNNDQGIEDRRVTSRVVLPTLGLIALVKAVVENLEKQKDLLISQGDTVNSQLKELISQVQVAQVREVPNE